MSGVAASWTPERRAVQSVAMRAFWERRRSDLAARATEMEVPQADITPAAAPEPQSKAVSERTAWTEARALLLARMSVVEVARELQLPTGRVSALAEELGVAKSKLSKGALRHG
ncbi:hypothetical protein [Teichococcus aestuarii]|uniref:hypothetical protein n=1 Tax=Teichococcus aestuarii TaxID=568898 RepID=UPI00361686AC